MIGVEKLQAAIDAIDAMQTAGTFSKTDALKIVNPLLREQDIRLELAKAWIEKREDVAALVGMLGEYRGLKATANNLLGIIKGRAAAYVRAMVEDQTTQLSECITLENVCEDLIVPPGYELAMDGLHALKVVSNGVEKKLIAHRPLFVSRKYINITSNVSELDLCFFNVETGKWITLTVDRADLMDARKVVGLSGRNVPVTSTTASAFVNWIAAFEAINGETMPTAGIVSSLGWLSTDEISFDSFYIGSERINSVYHPTDKRTIDLRPSEGFGSKAKGYEPQGTKEAWLAMYAEVTNYFIPTAVAYSVLASPLLKILECDPFVLDINGMSGGGKSTALKLGASMIGKPTIGDDDGLIVPWKSTTVGREYYFGWCNGLPVFMDETNALESVQELKSVGSTVFMWSQGIGKMRGDKGTSAIRDALTWSGILLSTGERPITSFDNRGGVGGRVIQCQGAPFGDDKVTGVSISNKVLSTIALNYGHIMPEFMQYVMDNKGKWGEWREEYKISCEILKGELASRGESRLANYAAAILFTKKLATEFGFPVPATSVSFTNKLLDCVRHGALDIDKPQSALWQLFSWIQTQEGNFMGTPEHERDALRGQARIPIGGWYGIWKNKGNSKEDFSIEFSRLSMFLTQRGFNPKEIIERWYETEVVKTSKIKSRYPYSTGKSFRGMKMVLINIDIKTFTETMNVDCDASEDMLARRQKVLALASFKRAENM